ncbi:hypothetical protein D6810_02015 [Candidatus Dojkabacteria bacterium]|uniref:Acetate kinase n=1 Tax=Candidatus Dojkabacteria bacterium TaxID=2099670 RepID=A0A3M0YYG8_9BACT|nr:MAG: hypothetical protein D6810_02015 [Candidatus Dojkabacteria bacterium]
MKIFVFNSGSSSLKVSVFKKNRDRFEVVKRIEAKNRDTIYTVTDGSTEFEISSWDDRLQECLNYLKSLGYIIDSESVVLHRLVHGLDLNKSIARVNSELLSILEEKSQLIAPLHNPSAIEIIKRLMLDYPDSDNFVCFDTFFGFTIPRENYLYGLPKEISESIGVRKYLFHGISYSYISDQLRNINEEYFLSKKIVICHLGSGSSVCAIKHLQALDGSFGFSPMENLLSSTRVGELDVDAYRFIKHLKNLSDTELLNILNFKSGLLALSGYSSDMKVLVDDYSLNSNAKLAVDVYVSSVAKYIYQMVCSLGGLDILIFTGGIGQNSEKIRQMICGLLTVFRINLTDTTNQVDIQNKGIIKVSNDTSDVEVYIAETKEDEQMVKIYTNLNT